jgi:uncharacterized RDD family membrane protein YckC
MDVVRLYGVTAPLACEGLWRALYRLWLTVTLIFLRDTKSPIMHTNTHIYYASFKQRLLANIIDIAMVFGITVIIFLYLLSKSDNYRAVQVNAVQSGIMFGLFLYMPVFESYGGTLGKRVVKITPVSKRDEITTPSLWAGYKKYLFYALPMLSGMLLYIVIMLCVFMTGNETTISQYRHGEIEPSPATIGQVCFYIVCALYIITPFTTLFNKKRQAWHDRFAGIVVKSKVPNEKPKTDIAGVEIPHRVINRKKTFFSTPKFSVSKSVFTSKIAYLIYLLLFVLIIMLTKYYLDVKRDEKHFELKWQYENQ